MTKATGGYAFPTFVWQQGYNQMMPMGGMTLRDHFAEKALAALILKDKDYANCGAAAVPKMAQWAYEYADAMLAEREKP